MNKEQLYEAIEAYLEGKMAAESRQAFEKEMAADPELQAEVALHRRLHEELGKSDKAKRREQLRQIAREFPLEQKNRRATIAWLIPLSGAVAAAIIGAVIWWALPRSGQPTWQQEQGQASAADRLPDEQAAAPDSLIAVNPEPEREEAAPSLPQPKPAAPPPAADPFRPNPQLEGLIAAETRDADILISATAEAAPTTSENFRATVAGTLRSASKTEDARIQLTLYDNRPDSYRKERPAARIPLELQRLEDDEVMGFGRMKSYTFEKEMEKELPPGLYYYVIKREGEDKPLFVGKVQVKKEN